MVCSLPASQHPICCYLVVALNKLIYFSMRRENNGRMDVTYFKGKNTYKLPKLDILVYKMEIIQYLSHRIK